MVNAAAVLSVPTAGGGNQASDKTRRSMKTKCAPLPAKTKR